MKCACKLRDNETLKCLGHGSSCICDGDYQKLVPDTMCATCFEKFKQGIVHECKK